MIAASTLNSQPATVGFCCLVNMRNLQFLVNPKACGGECRERWESRQAMLDGFFFKLTQDQASWLSSWTFLVSP